jgi:hypothetical protein
VLSEVGVEKSIEMGMVVLEQMSWFRLDPAPEVVLPKESAVPPPPAIEASGSTVEVVADVGSQVVVKEAMP